MASQLQAAGALTDPSRYAPLFTNRMFTGIWTNRSPLRDAATPFLQEKFYSATRQDSILDGINVELTSRLTLARRPGCSIYNSQSFPSIDRFYEFRRFSASTEDIRVMADTASTVYDATGPNTRNSIWQKGDGAGRTFFQSVGNVLYFGNGVEQKKWVTSTLSWTPQTAFNPGDHIIDPNNNLQVVAGAVKATIVSLSVAAGILTLKFSTPSAFVRGAPLDLTDLTTQTTLNGTQIVVLSTSGQTITAATSLSNSDVADETGIASMPAPTLTSIGEPAWSTVLNVGTIDGGIFWVNKGSAVSDWMFDGPNAAPTLAQASLPAAYPLWQSGTTYSSSLQFIDENSNIQKLTTSGITGTSEPTWNQTPGGITQDGTAVWTNQGPGGWNAGQAHSVGDNIEVEFTYYVQVQDQDNPAGVYSTHTEAVTVNGFFQCTVAGTSNYTQPDWVDGNGSLVQDNTVTWVNQGRAANWASLVGPGASVALARSVIDSNGNLQTITNTGKSGSAPPNWATAAGATTVDNTALWTNQGSYSQENTAPWIYSYSYGNSVTYDESNRSPLSLSVTLAANSFINVQGYGSNDPQVDTINLYRTLQGGSTQLLVASFPAPGAGMLWSYTDKSSDSALNPFIQASTTNYPPPAGLTALAYHLNRMWGAVNNVVYYTVAIGSQVGVSVSSFPPLNSFTFPSRVTRLWPCTLGLLVFTVSDVYIIQGTATTGDQLFSDIFVNGLGLLSYDAFGVNGTTVYLMTADQQVLSLDPGAGITESSFPIADLIETGGRSISVTGYDPTQTGFDPAQAYLTFHSQGSRDKALYVADGVTGWYRMAPVTAPESGFAWSPKADIVGGCQAIKSVEVLPGIKRLLIGGVTDGPILQRDLAVNTDNLQPYPAGLTFGSVMLAQEGQLAGLMFISTRCYKRGSRPTVGVLLGEIAGDFETLNQTIQEPPLLPPSKTLWADRYNLSELQQPVWCHHFQMQLTWPAEDAANELLSFTLFGELRSEFKN